MEIDPLHLDQRWGCLLTLFLGITFKHYLDFTLLLGLIASTRCCCTVPKSGGSPVSCTDQAILWKLCPARLLCYIGCIS